MKTRPDRNDFYGSREWKELRERVKKQWIARGKPCAYCGEPIRKGQRTIADHVKTVREFPALALDVRNIVVMHHACHSRKTTYMDHDKRPMLSVTGLPEGW